MFKIVVNMKKTLKIGIFAIIVVFVGIVSAAILLQVKKPLTLENMNDTYQGVIIKTVTQKNIYEIGEPISISAELSNTNTNDTVFYLWGYTYPDTGEFYTKLHVEIYDEDYTKVWYFEIPGKYEIMSFGSNPYNITVPGLSTVYFTDIVSWNQTAKNIGMGVWDEDLQEHIMKYDFNKQVPPGIYYIMVKVPLDFDTDFTFGSMKKIIIQ